jgi:hypothetical protein
VLTIRTSSMEEFSSFMVSRSPVHLDRSIILLGHAPGTKAPRRPQTVHKKTANSHVGQAPGTQKTQLWRVQAYLAVPSFASSSLTKKRGPPDVFGLIQLAVIPRE